MNRFVVAMVLGLASLARAQDTSSLDGDWTVKWQTDKGVPAQADVVIKGQEGTWYRMGGGRRADPCVFRKVSIAVRTQGAGEVSLELQRSALEGCQDTTFTFRRLDDKTLERTLSGGQTMRMTR